MIVNESRQMRRRSVHWRTTHHALGKSIPAEAHLWAAGLTQVAAASPDGTA